MNALKVLLIITICLYMTYYAPKFWAYYFGILIPYYIVGQLFFYDPKNSSPKKKAFISMWTSPYDPQIYGTIKFKVNALKEAIENYNKKNNKRIEILTVFVKAIAVCFQKFPAINGKIMFGNYVPKETTDISLVVYSEKKKETEIITIKNCDKLAIDEIESQIAEKRKYFEEGTDKNYARKQFFVKVLPTL